MAKKLWNVAFRLNGTFIWADTEEEAIAVFRKDYAHDPEKLIAFDKEVTTLWYPMTDEEMAEALRQEKAKRDNQEGNR